MADHLEPIIDNWAQFSYKRALSARGRAPRILGVGSWVGDHDRRLKSYRILDGYTSNIARVFLSDADEERIAQHREYGDADLIVEEVLSSLIGEEQVVTVPADDEDEAAAEREEFLREWVRQERFIMKLQDAERKAVKLGDAVYVISWSSGRGRPRLRTWDPGYYFPVLTDFTDEDFPQRVHFAWDVEDEDGKTKRVRRITYELLPLKPMGDERGFTVVDDNGPVWADNITFDEEGRPQRQYPWNEEPSGVACYMTDAIFEVDPLNAKWDDFSDARAIYNRNEEGEVIRSLDLGIDFMPIVHMPNTIAEEEHFGTSSLARVIQLLDEIAGADTLLASAAATSGAPAYAISGGPGLATTSQDTDDPVFRQTFPTWRGSGGPQKFGPGAVISAPQGKVELLSTADAVKPGIEYTMQLLERLSVNSRIPSSKLGRLKPSEVPSGIALALSFSPLRSMIGQMRLVRDEKYSLLFKFVQRFYQLFEQIEPGPDNIFDAQVAFGAFLPADRTGAIRDVQALASDDLVSRRTLLLMLQEAGVPIEDVDEELERIKAEQIENGTGLPPPPLFGEPPGTPPPEPEE